MTPIHIKQSLIILFIGFSGSLFSQSFNAQNDSIARNLYGDIDTSIVLNPFLSIHISFIEREEAEWSLIEHDTDFDLRPYNPDYQDQFLLEYEELNILPSEKGIQVDSTFIEHPARLYYPSTRIDTFYDNHALLQVVWGWDEGMGYELINVNTGAHCFSYGTPSIALDGSFAIAVNCDLDAGYTPSGFELYSLFDGIIDVHPPWRTKTWGPTEFVWLNKQNGLALCRAFSNSNNYMHDVQFYVLVTLKEH